MIKTILRFSMLIALPLTSFLLNSCRDSSTDLVYNHQSGVSVRATNSSLFITNNTSETIYHFLIEQRIAAVTDWTTSCNAAKAIGAGSTKEILYSEIYGYHEECVVLFYWWNCRQTGSDESNPDLLQSMSFKTY